MGIGVSKGISRVLVWSPSIPAATFENGNISKHVAFGEEQDATGIIVNMQNCQYANICNYKLSVASNKCFVLFIHLQI